MSDHLPECDTPHNHALPCICDVLRQCEERVREDERGKAKPDHVDTCRVYNCEGCVEIDMEHEPLCPNTKISMSGHSTPPADYELTYTVCQCALIREVRAEAQADMDHVSYVLGQTAERQRSVLLIADAYAKGRADALSAAREAVADALGPNSPGGSIALAAIAALKETQ